MPAKRSSSIDIVNEVLEQCILAYPVSSFIISLYKQYMERGSLSKKQLQGLHGKASAIKDLPAGKLATLQAIINKMPNRFKSDKPAATPLYVKDESAGKMIEAVLAKYPQHKRVLYLKAKYDNKEQLSPAELTELNKFAQVANK